MIKKVTILLLFACSLPITASAQTATGVGGAIAGAQSQSGAISHSGVNLGNGSPSTYNNFGGNTNFPHQAPAAFAPGLAVGAEVCAQSVSVGASSPLGGLSFGTTVIDEGCDSRVTARMLYSMGNQAAATAILCKMRKVREAYSTIGTPCPGDPGFTAGDLEPQINATKQRIANEQAVARGEPMTDPYFYDKRGRAWEERQFANERQAKRAGAMRSSTGEWVVLAASTGLAGANNQAR